MRVHYLQHVPFEGLAYLQTWLSAGQHTLTSSQFYSEYQLPDVHSIDAVIILGGPMGIYDETEYPWLIAEKAWIKAAIAADKWVLGICLGAQLIADALGAKVSRNPGKEIGWFDLQKTAQAEQSILGKSLPNTLTAFHWHGDTFDLPPQATWLYQSAACRHQAFVYREKVLALQFHLEITQSSAEALITHCGQELNDAATVPTIQSAAQILASDDDTRFIHLNQLAAQFFSAFFNP